MRRELEKLRGIHPSYFDCLSSPDNNQGVLSEFEVKEPLYTKARISGRDRLLFYLFIVVFQGTSSLLLVQAIQSGRLLPQKEIGVPVSLEKKEVDIKPLQQQIENVTHILSVLVPAVLGKAVITEPNGTLVDNRSKETNRTQELAGKIGKVESQKVLLRKKPMPDAPVLAEIAAGNSLLIVSKEDNWFQVISPTGDRAWTEASGLTLGGEV